MGAVDLVIQIEAPPSVASGMQRIGRAGHQVGAVVARRHLPQVPRRPAGRARPSRRACARARSRRPRYPRNPLDVLAQQIVAIVAVDAIGRRRALRARAPRGAVRRAAARVVRGRARHALGPLPVGRVRRAAAAHHLGPRRRHASARARGRSASPSSTAARSPTAGSTACTSPASGPRRSLRVGELDEEMVFESRTGDVFLLGASSWRVEEITHDRVLVSPAPGRARQDAVLARRPARPAARVRRAPSASSRRTLAAAKPTEAVTAAPRAPRPRRSAPPSNLLATWTSRRGDRRGAERPDHRRRALPATSSATGACACCRRSARACTRRGRWRSLARLRGATGGGRRERCGPTTASCSACPRASEPPEVGALPAGRGRGRGPGRRRASARRRSSPRASARTPRARCSCRGAIRAGDAALGAAQARRRPAGGRLAVRVVPDPARDLPRVPARRVRPARRWSSSCAGSRRARIRVMTVDSRTPSPFAASLLFSYVANFIYDGDAPLAERRAQALALDHAQLASCSARPSCASCSTPRRSRRSSARSSGSRAIACGTPTACTTCCSRSAT